MTSPLLRQVLRFVVVGAAGFVVDGGLLWLLLGQGVDGLLARAVSFPAAVTITFALNRAWTFGVRGRSALLGQLNAYLAVQLTGAFANYAVFAAWVAFAGSERAEAMVGFVFGSALGLLVNFTGARLVVFAEKS